MTTLQSTFLLSTLRWRGLKFSPTELFLLLERIPPSLNLKEYQAVLETHFLLPKSVSANWFETCVKEYEWLIANEAQIVTFFDSHYPDFFRRLREPPMILTWWGNIEKKHSDLISVVGSRHPSPDTLKWMEHHFDIFIQTTDATVVSGGAIGIDQKAHMIALRNSKPTICVVPAGLKYLYPATLNSWKPLLLESGGALVSPFSPFSTMEKRFFVERNRYIACWSKLTFVLEAKRRSGTMVTARWAGILEHNIAVLPCSPVHCGLGGLDLIVSENGILIRDHQDLSTAFEIARVKSLPICEASEDLLG